MYPARSEARKSTAPATSSGRPNRPKRNPAQHGRPGLLGQGAGHVGLDEAGRNGIHQDVAAAVLLGDRLGESDQPRLAGSIVGLALVAGEADDAGDIDDPPARRFIIPLSTAGWC